MDIFERETSGQIISLDDPEYGKIAAIITEAQKLIAEMNSGYVSYVGVPHGVQLDGEQLFFEHVHLHGGPAPVRRYLPKLIDLVLDGKINPGKVFDLTLPLEQVADAYRAMDERRAIKTLLCP